MVMCNEKCGSLHRVEDSVPAPLHIPPCHLGIGTGAQHWPELKGQAALSRGRLGAVQMLLSFASSPLCLSISEPLR